MTTKSKALSPEVKDMVRAAIIACVDPRMHTAVQKTVKELQQECKKRGEQVGIETLRTGGSNFAEAQSSVLELAHRGNLKYLVFLPHYDCKVMGVVFKHLNEGYKVTHTERKIFTKPFERVARLLSDTQTLEELNGPTQVALAKAALSKAGYNPEEINISVDLINLENVAKTNKHTAYFAPPVMTIDYKKRPEMKGCAVFQGPDIVAMIGSIEAVHKALQFDRIKILSTPSISGFMMEQAKMARRIADKSDVLKGVSIEIVEIKK